MWTSEAEKAPLKRRAARRARSTVPITWDALPVPLVLAIVYFLLSSPGAYAQGAPERYQTQEERIHFGDLIDIDVVGSLEFDWRGRLSPEGFLDGPERLASPVFALCRTESEVAAAVREGYSKVLRSPNVVVRIIDRSNRALAYIDGAVRTPQRLQLRRRLSLPELIVLSGGITDASSGEIVIFRPPNVNCREAAETSFENASTQAPRRLSVKIPDLLSGKTGADFQVLPGDIVTVVEAGPVFVSGDVRTPRRLNITPEMTLSRAVAAAGGAVKPFNGQTVRVYRRGVTEPITFDLSKIASGSQPDPKLEPFDVVEVEQKGVDPKRLALPESAADRRSEGLSKLPLRIVD